MEQSRIGNQQTRRCNLQDSHGSAVQHISFCGKTNTFVTGGMDGGIKLWSVTNVSVLWEWVDPKQLVPDPCLQVAWHSEGETIMAAFRGGRVVVWTGGLHSSGSTQEIIIESLERPSSPGEDDKVSLLLDVSRTEIKLLVHLTESHQMHRIGIPFSSIPRYERTCLEGPLGAITNVRLNPGPKTSGSPSPPRSPVVESGLLVPAPLLEDPVKALGCVVAGDSLGYLNFWNWDADGGDGRLASVHRFEAHRDGAVCAIEISNSLLVTGR